MEKFDSISHFLQSGEFDYRVFEMGRKVIEIANDSFAEIEAQQKVYPYPFQQSARIALLFWPQNRQADAVIWFLQFPVDELGYLKLQSRDAFLLDLFEQTGKNIQAKQVGKDTLDNLAESPFAFKPQPDKLAIFHAFATRLLGQPASKFYGYAREYLTGNAGFEQWQFLGLQGVADVISRLDQDDNKLLLAKAIKQMPDAPLIVFAQALEHITPQDQLQQALQQRLNAELESVQASAQLIAALIRSLSSCDAGESEEKLLIKVLSSPVANDIEVLVAFSGRAWMALEDAELRSLFLQKLAQQNQSAFAAVLTDLIKLPGLREQFLYELKKTDHPEELKRQINVFLENVTIE